MPNVLVLGGTGMLGRSCVQELNNHSGVTRFTSRSGAGIDFDAQRDSMGVIAKYINPGDFIINCLGITKPHIDESSPNDAIPAGLVNGLFPARLACLAESVGAFVIQIATDCVYSGSKGLYTESDCHDAKDIYGKSKSIGEVQSPNVMLLRCSTIGREFAKKTMLLEWVLSREHGSRIPGYVDHLWNGITTTHFAKIAAGVIDNMAFRSGLSHVVPQGFVSKAELVSQIAKDFGRNDLVIEPVISGHPINRTLSTEDPNFNRSLWRMGGYESLPSIRDMVAEIAK